MNRRVRGQNCTYCGERPGITADHVPPKLLFAEPRPSDLITVPSCLTCNKAFEKDDEYLRLMLVLKDECYKHPEVQRVLPAVLRGLRRQEKRRFTESFVRGMRKVQLRSEAGLYLGTRGSFDVDMSRLRRAVARVVRGLYFHHNQIRLPKEAEVRVWYDDDLLLQGEETIAELRRTILEPLALLGGRSIARQSFTYWTHQHEESTGLSAWIISFYDEVRFFALTSKTH